jgi:predicted kinase
MSLFPVDGMINGFSFPGVNLKRNLMLILVFGLPGTGKSYFSRKLKNILCIDYLNTDMIREDIGKKGEYSEESKQLIYNKLYEKTRDLLDKGEDLIIDGTFHKQKRRNRLRDIAGEKGHKFYTILMRADENTIRKRVKKDRKYSEAGFEVYEKIKDEFEEVTEDPLVLWSDRESTEEMLRKVKKMLYG